MDDFRRGEIQVLVSTSVVEVGVDVPNATLMTIESGQRFGLAQLHQLRGRISRGSFPGSAACSPIRRPTKPASGSKPSSATTDGFKLAETDLQLRGPGDLFGTQAARPAALPHRRSACATRPSSKKPAATPRRSSPTDPGLALPDHARLRRMMLGRYGQALELGDVG